jgi:hypothetical protein
MQKPTWCASIMVFQKWLNSQRTPQRVKKLRLPGKIVAGFRLPSIRTMQGPCIGDVQTPRQIVDQSLRATNDVPVVVGAIFGLKIHGEGVGLGVEQGVGHVP